MGRQAYLAKIAFGRSAFEPTDEVTESDEYIQIGAPQPDELLPQRYREAAVNNYIQLYDERGNPINPRSHAYGKRLRDAQNDVLALVGVVERRRSPSEGLPGSYGERLEELEAEETAGNTIALTSTIVENLCTWWIGTIRDRILTFRIPTAIPFLEIVATERSASGNSIVYTGFTSRLISTIGMQTIVYGAYVYQPIERLMRLTRASSNTRRFVRRTRGIVIFAFRLSLEVLIYPFSYHANLQRLGLVPARPLLPYWKSFNPLSTWSPLSPLSIYHDVSVSPLSAVKAIVTSPMVLTIAEHFYERWIYSAIFEAVESSIIRPDNADMESRDAVNRDRAASILGLQRKSPPLIRKAIHKLLVFLGWSEPSALGETEWKPFVETTLSEERRIESGGTQVVDLMPLHVPVPGTNRVEPDGGDEAVVTVPAQVIDDSIRPTTPPTPTVSDNDDNDPRIRITSREGIVEMEVRLPPRVISSHTEVLNAQPTLPRQNRGTSRANYRQSASRPHHRVTQLSTEPAQMIGAIVKAQLVGLAVLPFKLVVLRLVASHYVASQAQSGVVPRFVEPVLAVHDLSLRSVGTGLSRLALCAAFELAIDLSLWSAQYLAVTTVGTRVFGWGKL